MADISVKNKKHTLQSFVVSMETEIHERIINDRRTMVVVDDDRWSKSKSKSKSKLLEAMLIFSWRDNSS